MQLVIDNINFFHLVNHVIENSKLEILIVDLAILATCKFALNGSEGMSENVNNFAFNS